MPKINPNWTQYIRELPVAEQADLLPLMVEQGIVLDDAQLPNRETERSLAGLLAGLPEDSPYYTVLAETVGLVARIRKTEERSLEKVAAVRLQSEPPLFTQGDAVTHPLLGAGEVLEAGYSRHEPVWVQFYNGVRAALLSGQVSRGDCCRKREIVYPPAEAIQEAIDSASSFTAPHLFFDGQLYLFLHPRTVGGRQERGEFNRKNLAVCARSIRRNGFSIEKAPPVFQLLPLDPSAGRVGQEIVAPDGHHRTRSAGKAISQDGFIVVGGRKTQRLPVRVIGEAELREHEDGFHRPLTPWQLFLEFNTACQSFGREFRAVKHPALAAFYAAQTAKIVQVPFALVESGRDDYPLPHVGMTSSALPGGGVNQDGLLRFLDKSMALVVAVMDGLGGHVKSEDAVDIAGSTVVSSMQQKADLPLSVSEANRAVLDFHGQNGFKERRKKSEELFPPATTFTGARIYAEDGKFFVERAGVGDSYQFVIRHEKGHWIRRFDIERHFRVLDEDPKLELPPHLQDVLVSSTIGSVDMKVSHDVVELEEGDFVFLCSDGVLKNVQFFEISKLLDAAVREAADHNWSARQMLEKFSKNLHVLVEERQRAHIAYKKLKPDAQRKLEGSREARSELDDFTFATVIVLKDPVVDWNRLLDKGFSNVAAEPYSEKTTVETDKVEGSPVVSRAPGSLSLATGGFATGGFALRGMGSGLVGAMSQTPTPLRVLTTK